MQTPIPDYSGGLIPLPNAMPGTGTPGTLDDDIAQYLPIDRLRRQYNDYLGIKMPEIEEQRQARQYYHGAQWTDDELKALRRRKQPPRTNNIISRKIDGVVGIIERLRQEPKAYGRTPQQAPGADLATAILRYGLDRNDWKSKASRISRIAAIDGIGGLEYELVQGDHGDPDLEFHIVYPDSFFYDVRSYDEGFTDARYLGQGKWIDVEQAQDLFPQKADLIGGLVEQGADLTSNADREKAWVNTTEKRVRLVDHWYVHKGVWCWCAYISSTVLMEGVSPFVDEKGKTFPKYRMFSAIVDHEGDRYGFFRNWKSLQDEINHWASKAAHIANSKRLIAAKGAVDDVEKARREWARPDGFIEENIKDGIRVDDSRSDLMAMLEFKKAAMEEIENFGPNPALLGQGLEDSSGRAINLLQQAAMADIGPYLSAVKNWKLRVYRDCLNIMQRHWTSERWIRVTDDQNLAQYLQVNKLTIDQYGQPSIINAIGSLDVDIILDEGPDTINMQADAYMAIQSLGPGFAQENPEIVLEVAPLPADIKKRALDKLKQKSQQPPAPDPKVQAQLQIAQGKAQHDMMLAQADQQAAAAKYQMEWRKAQLAALTQIEVARIGAKTDADSASLAARLEAMLGFTQIVHEKQEAAQDRQHEHAMAEHQATLQPEPAVGI